jgi:hypothetical protein
MSIKRYIECIDIAMDALRAGDAATAAAGADLASEIRIGSRWLNELRESLVDMVAAAGPDGLDRDSLSADAEALVPGLIRDCRVVSRYRDGSGYRLIAPRFTPDALLATLEAAGVDGMTQSEADREHGARAVRDAMASGAAVRVRRGGGFRLFAAEYAPKKEALPAADETDWENLS